MKKKVLISTNNNPNYFFYVPIVEWAWNKFGWEVVLLKTPNALDVMVNSESTKVIEIPHIEGMRTATMAQCSRFFVANVLDKEDLLQVNDIDVIPLVNFWNPDPNKFTIYGHDTTGYGYIPIHYATAKVSKWYDLMGCTGNFKEDMEREVNITKHAFSDNWEQYWFADWDLFTKRCAFVKDDLTFIDRGMVHLAKDPTAKNRLDRYDMDKTRNQILLDCHADNNNPSAPYKWGKLRSAMVEYFGSIPEWMDNYVDDFFKKYGE